MEKFRVETVVDKKTGLIFAELYHPDDAIVPMAATQPIYPTHEEATSDIVDMMKKSFPDQPIKTNP